MEQGKLLILGRKVNSHGQLRAVFRGLSALLIGLLLSQAANAATYKWKDDQGQTMFTQIPPDDGRPYQKIGAPPPPPDGPAARKKLQEQRQGFADRQEDKRLTEEKSAKAAEKNALVEENCDKARRNLSSLQGSPGRMIRMPDGSYQRMTEEQRQAKIKETNDYLDKNCR